MESRELKHEKIWNCYNLRNIYSNSYEHLWIFFSFLNFSYKFGIQLDTRLRLGLSRLLDHKFKYGFLDSLNLICNYGSGIETTVYLFLHFLNFWHQRLPLLHNIRKINATILNLNNLQVSNILLFGGNLLNEVKEKTIYFKCFHQLQIYQSLI